MAQPLVLDPGGFKRGLSATDDILFQGQSLAAIHQALANLAGAGQGVIYPTLAALNADVAHPAGTLGLVYNDGSNSGYYAKSGASGSGAWAATLLTSPTQAAAALWAQQAAAAASSAVSSAGQGTFLTRAAAMATSILSSLSALTLLGVAGAGLGPGTWARAAAAPTAHSAYFTSKDGAVWVQTAKRVTPAMVGAVHDAIKVYDLSITSGSKVVTSLGQASWAASDVGKSFCLSLPAGGTFASTIASVQSATQITLADAAPVTITAFQLGDCTTAAEKFTLASAGTKFTSAHTGLAVTIPYAGYRGATLRTVIEDYDSNGVGYLHEPPLTSLAAASGTDLTTTAGSNIVGYTSSAWSAYQEGAPITIQGGGAAGAALATTISLYGYNTANAFSLAAQASTSVSGASWSTPAAMAVLGAMAVYGTDDATAIQTAASYAKATGATLVLEAAAYLCLSSVSFDSIAVQGDGNLSELVLGYQGRGHSIGLVGTRPKINSVRVTTLGNCRGGDHPGQGAGGIYADQAAFGWEVQGCRVDGGTGVGIFAGGRDGVVAHNRVTCTWADGISLLNGARDIDIHSNDVFASGDDCISAPGYRSNGRPVNGINVHDNRTYLGRSRGVAMLGAENVRIRGNLIRLSSGPAILIGCDPSYSTFGAKNGLATENQLYRCMTGYAIPHAASPVTSGGIITIYGASGSYSDGQGGTLTLLSERIVVARNQVLGTGGGANCNQVVSISQYTSDCAVDDNYFDGTLGSPGQNLILVSGNNTKVRRNTLKNASSPNGIYLDANVTGNLVVDGNESDNVAPGGYAIFTTPVSAVGVHAIFRNNTNRDGANVVLAHFYMKFTRDQYSMSGNYTNGQSQPDSPKMNKSGSTWSLDLTQFANSGLYDTGIFSIASTDIFSVRMFTSQYFEAKWRVQRANDTNQWYLLDEVWTESATAGTTAGTDYVAFNGKYYRRETVYSAHNGGSGTWSISIDASNTYVTITYSPASTGVGANMKLVVA